MTIRNAVPEDAARIAEVHVASWRVAYRGLMPEDLLRNLDTKSRANAWFQLLENPPLPCYVAEHNDRIVGFVHLEPCRDADKTPEQVGEITALYVHPDYWRRGYGGLLLHRGLEKFRERGAKEVTLWVLEANLLGRAFYEKEGFRSDGAQKIHKRSGLVEVRYALQNT